MVLSQEIIDRIRDEIGPDQDVTDAVPVGTLGIDLETADAIISDLHALPHVKLTGLDTHLGSPINTVDPYVQALRKVLPLLERARAAGHQVEYLNIGGGYGIEYRGGETATPADYAAAIVPLIKKSGCKLIMEPGRFIVGNAGIMLSRVTYVKESGDKAFAICDAAMNDLIRPALYDSYHKIWPVTTDKALSECLGARADRNGYANFDVVGPVCESGDFLAKGRTLPRMAEGDLLSIFSTGAYGMSMSSNYNSRPRAAEVMVSGAGYRVVRQRETYDDLIRAERFD